MSPLPSPVPSVGLWQLDLLPRGSDTAVPLGIDDQQRVRELVGDHGPRLVARRALLREAVAALTGCDPGSVEILESDGPRTVRAGDSGTLHYSSSSAGSTGLLALARHPVGVDVEARPGPPDALLVSRHLLAEAEHRWIAASGTASTERFLEVWVRKEAVVKCTGEGMQRDLRSFVVDATRDPAPVTGRDPVTAGLSTYAVPLHGHAAALAVAAVQRPEELGR